MARSEVDSSKDEDLTTVGELTPERTTELVDMLVKWKRLERLNAKQSWKKLTNAIYGIYSKKDVQLTQDEFYRALERQNLYIPQHEQSDFFKFLDRD